MTELAGFVRETRGAARALRALPAALDETLRRDLTSTVAEPLAARVRRDYTGPWAQTLAAATAVTTTAGSPTITVGGSTRRVSGGATGRQLVYGAQYGSRGRTATVRRRTRRGTTTYRARTGRQFTGKATPTIDRTLRQAGPWVLDRVASLVDAVLERGTR